MEHVRDAARETAIFLKALVDLREDRLRGGKPDLLIKGPGVSRKWRGFEWEGENRHDLLMLGRPSGEQNYQPRFEFAVFHPKEKNLQTQANMAERKA